MNFRNYTNSELTAFIANVAPRNHEAEAELCHRVITGNHYYARQEYEVAKQHEYDRGNQDGRREAQERLVLEISDMLTFHFGDKIEGQTICDIIDELEKRYT